MSTQFPKPKDLAYKLRRIRENFKNSLEEMAEDLKRYGETRRFELDKTTLDAEMIRQIEAGEIEGAVNTFVGLLKVFRHPACRFDR